MNKINSKALGKASKFFYDVILLSILLTSSSANGQWKLLTQASSVATTIGTQTTSPEEPDLSLKEQIRRIPAGGVIEPIHAPFSMPQLKRPVFPDRTFSIADYGARSGGETKNTKAFVEAIKACNKAGGGKVVVPAGKWLTGPIHLKSNVHLYLSEGSEIIFSDLFEDYLPVVLTRWEGVECYNYSPFIYAKDCENIAVTGPGVLNGNGERWWSWHQHQSKAVLRLLKAEAEGVPVKERIFGTVENALRPTFIQPVNCKNVWLEGFTLKKGAFWSVQMIYCENAIVRELAIHSQGYPNGDGVNSDSSRNILIEYCYFDTDDDAVAIKSGKNEDGRRVGKSSENIVVRHCYSKGPRWGSISIGSEMSGGVRNVYIKDVEFDGTLLGFQIKTKPGRGGVVENVWVEDVRASDLHYPVFFLNTAYGADTFTPSVLAMPRLRNIFARNIRSTQATESNSRPILINGLEEVPAENIRLENFTCQGNFGPAINLARQIQLDNVHVTVQKGPAITMKNCQDVSLSNSAADKPCDVFLRVEGENSGNIHLENNDLQNTGKAVQLGDKVPADAVVSKATRLPEDRRLGKLRSSFDTEFPMQSVADDDDWPARRNEIRTRILVAAGLHPMPKRSPLNPIIYGKVERDDYTVERVIFESFPGHYVTGSLYRPKTPARGKRPAVLSPHGHWEQGRFTDLGVDVAKEKIESGGERIENNARHHLQARCVQLARMGCVVLFYDMEGYADNVQIVNHWLGPRPGDPDQPGYLLLSTRAELQGQTLFGLQTWNSIRAVDFISSLPDVDPDRIGVTGASGGGTQSMILGAVDERIAASMPAVMVSEAMQGGCVCENAQYLRINQGNIDIAAATAPRPLGLLAADDWTRELETKGHPDLKALYQMLYHPENYEAHFHLQFPHNYNSVNRHHMYNFMNRHLNLGLSEPIVERPFIPLDIDEANVWTDAHPKPSGDDVGPPHERKLTAEWTEATKAALAEMEEEDQCRVIAEGLTTMVGRSAGEIGPVRWDPSDKVIANDYFLLTGRLTVTEHGEQLPAMFIYPKKNRNFQTVIWLSDTGKDSMFGPDGDLIPAVSTLVGKGYCVASIDMFGQGEFLKAGDGKAIESVCIFPQGKITEPYQKAACFYFGYNPPLLIQRVHDVMSVAEYLRNGADEFTTKKIHLVALGRQAGPAGLIARFVLADYIDNAAIDPENFDFASVNKLDDPMFLPGILRYGGIEAIWTLNHPLGTVEIEGPDASVGAVEGPYLFSYFTGNGEDGLHLVYSYDGLKWQKLKNGQSFLTPQVGSKLMRDPSICTGPDGTFHLVWSSGWWDKGFGIAHSKDLIHWSEQTWLEVMKHEPDAMNCWAPEIYYDDATREYLIFWSTTIPGRFPETDTQTDDGRTRNHRIYCVTTSDFETYTEPRLFYDGGFNAIDAMIVKDSNTYVMFVKDETFEPVNKKNIRIAIADKAEGPYSPASKPFSPDWVEGPTAIKIGDY